MTSKTSVSQFNDKRSMSPPRQKRKCHRCSHRTKDLKRCPGCELLLCADCCYVHDRKLHKAAARKHGLTLCKTPVAHDALYCYNCEVSACIQCACAVLDTLHSDCVTGSYIMALRNVREDLQRLVARRGSLKTSLVTLSYYSCIITSEEKAAKATLGRMYRKIDRDDVISDIRYQDVKNRYDCAVSRDRIALQRQTDLVRVQEKVCAEAGACLRKPPRYMFQEGKAWLDVAENVPILPLHTVTIAGRSVTDAELMQKTYFVDLEVPPVLRIVPDTQGDLHIIDNSVPFRKSAVAAAIRREKKKQEKTGGKSQGFKSRTNKHDKTSPQAGRITTRTRHSSVFRDVGKMGDNVKVNKGENKMRPLTRNSKDKTMSTSGSGLTKDGGHEGHSVRGKPHPAVVLEDIRRTGELHPAVVLDDIRRTGELQEWKSSTKGVATESCSTTQDTDMKTKPTVANTKQKKVGSSSRQECQKKSTKKVVSSTGEQGEPADHTYSLPQHPRVTEAADKPVHIATIAPDTPVLSFCLDAERRLVIVRVQGRTPLMVYNHEGHLVSKLGSDTLLSVYDQRDTRICFDSARNYVICGVHRKYWCRLVLVPCPGPPLHQVLVLWAGPLYLRDVCYCPRENLYIFMTSDFGVKIMQPTGELLKEFWLSEPSSSLCVAMYDSVPVLMCLQADRGRIVIHLSNLEGETLSTVRAPPGMGSSGAKPPGKDCTAGLVSTEMTPPAGSVSLGPSGRLLLADPGSMKLFQLDPQCGWQTLQTIGAESNPGTSVAISYVTEDRFLVVATIQGAEKTKALSHLELYHYSNDSEIKEL